MERASLTVGMKNALSSLSNIQDQIEGTNKRLATGKKVNSALDNALNYFVADSFSSKARGLQTIMENIGLGLNVLKQTDKALSSIKASLDQSEGTLRASLNTAGTNARITSTATFRDPLTGAASGTALLAEAATGSSANRLQVGDSVRANLVLVDVNGAVVSTVATATTITTTAGTTVQNLLDNLNASSGTGTLTLNVTGQAARVSAYLNDSGNIVIESNIAGTDVTGTLTYSLQLVADTGAGAGTQSVGNTLQAFSFSGGVGQNPTVVGTQTQTVTIIGSSTLQTTRAAAAASFREVLAQVRNSALDAGYNGTNLLQGDFLRISFNEENTTSLITQGNRMDASTLGFTLDNQTATTGDAIRNFQSDRDISNALAKIRTAKATIGGLSTTYASNANLLTNRQNYTEFAVKNFNDGADLLTMADINEEGATLASLQTKQQLSVQALSLANQSDQAILRLF